ncbi:MAG: hypothetical protein JWN70_265 [Planctomycetaceae bacterium]|nr:hypothetical protein [Planctomycetaceae bacterium]
MHPQRDLSSLPLRRATLIAAGLVAAFVPVMQVLTDRTPPQVSKPALAGVCLGMLLAGLCLFPRKLNLLLLLMSGMGLLTLGLAEFGCSLFMAPVSSSIYDWDDRTIYHTLPSSKKNYRRTTINGGQTSTISINSLGFRGPELPEASTEPRIIVYGDSFIEAEYSQFEQTFCERLRQDLKRQTGKSIGVINAGTNGYGPDQLLLRMEAELPRLKPQLVVLSLFADNDCGDLLRNKLFRLDADGKLIANQWSRAPDCQHPGSRGRYEPTLWKLARNAIRGLQSRGGVVESYMERWRLQCLAEYDEYITRGDSVVHDLQADHYDADVSLTPGCPSADYKQRLFARILERIYQVCVQNQTQLVVMIIPSPGDLIEGYDFCQIDHQKYPEYQPQALSNLFADAAREQHLPVVNLFDPFSKSDAQRLYFRGGDNHWNDEGQKLAAEIVAPVIAKILHPDRRLNP